MSELELRLRVLPRQRATLLQALGRRKLAQVSLAARYFDTADLLLARHGLALRLRREGAQWVQALKATLPGSLERLEDEVRLDGPATRARPELHADTRAGKRLQALLARHGQPALLLVWRTDVTRTLRRLQSHGADIEWALDEGRVEAGDRGRDVCELELELKGGDAAGLFAAAHDWLGRHGLWLDVVSKAERGALLHAGATLPPPVKACAPKWDARAAGALSGEAMLRAMVAACLQQILPNASALADGSDDPEHVHQLRVGLRRLRSVARAMAPFAQALPAHWEDDLRPAQDALGRHVDDWQAARYLEQLATAEPAAWFAVGWLRAQAAATVDDGARALRRLGRATPFWRR